jgi:hypothetical protein
MGNYIAFSLLEIVLEIHGDLVVEMDSVLSAHVVLVARVWEVVDLYVVHHACTHETEAVLP